VQKYIFLTNMVTFTKEDTYEIKVNIQTSVTLGKLNTFEKQQCSMV